MTALALLPDLVATAQVEVSVACAKPVLAVSLGARVGWALHWDDDHLASGVEVLPTRANERAFRRWLRDLVRLTKAEVVAWDAPVLGRRRDLADTELLPLHLEGVALAELAGRVHTFRPTTGEALEHVTWRKKPNPGRLAGMVRARFGRQATDPSELRALCVLAWALHELTGRAP